MERSSSPLVPQSNYAFERRRRRRDDEEDKLPLHHSTTFNSVSNRRRGSGGDGRKTGNGEEKSQKQSCQDERSGGWEDENEDEENGKEKNYKDFISRSEIVFSKPVKRCSSPAVRIQVTIHRPINWTQVSSGSSSSSITRKPRKFIKRCPSSPHPPQTPQIEDEENEDCGVIMKGTNKFNYCNNNDTIDADDDDEQQQQQNEDKMSPLVSTSSSPSSSSSSKRSSQRRIDSETWDHAKELSPPPPPPPPPLTTTTLSCSGVKGESHKMTTKSPSTNNNTNLLQQRRRKNLRIKRTQMNPPPQPDVSTDDSGVSESEEVREEGSRSSCGRVRRVKRRAASDSSTSRRTRRSPGEEWYGVAGEDDQRPVSTLENTQNPHLKISFSCQHSTPLSHRRHKREVISIPLQFQDPRGGTRQVVATQSFDFPSSQHHSLHQGHNHLVHRPRVRQDSHVPQTDSHSVMTWFREPQATHVKSKESCVMGANGSTHSGRLKARSQSSSALYCIKSGGGGEDPRHANTAYANGVLSNSIPADLWDLPPTTKSYSPITRKHSRPHLLHQQSAEYPSSQTAQGLVLEKNHKNQKHRPFPFVDAIIHRSSGHRDGRKGNGGKDGSGRSKFYAVSCPDVAEQASGDGGRYDDGGSFSHSRMNTNHLDYGYSSERSATMTTATPTPFDCDENRPPTRLLNSAVSFPHHPPTHYQLTGAYENQTYYDESSQSDLRRAGGGGGGGPIKFPFITKADIFEIRLIRDQRGLGLSVTGGSDSQECYPGLIRIKKVFPMSPAYQSGGLRPWDIILKANGVPLTGLTNYEALEVLRTTPVETILTCCRPNPPPSNIPGLAMLEQSTNSMSQPQLSHSQFYDSRGSYNHQQQQQQQQKFHTTYRQQQQQQPQLGEPNCGGDSFSIKSSASSAFNPSVKSKSLSSLKIPSHPQQSSSSQLPPPSSQHSYGEFQVTLEKSGGSLGFTLRQEDSSILGHYVRALVKDPALSDGRIQPGDRILSVNGHDLSGVSHADAIAFLRQCSAKVTMRLYRDAAPTPVSPLSPTESHKSLKTKPLRQEAIDMLNDLAQRKKMSGSDPKCSLPGSAVGRTSGLRGHKLVHTSQDGTGPATLPRRRHPGVTTPSPEVLSAALDRFAGRLTPKSNKSQSPESVKSSSHVGGPSASSSSHAHNYPAETRSSGSGESTPAGTITQSRSHKTERPTICGHMNNNITSTIINDTDKRVQRESSSDTNTTTTSTTIEHRPLDDKEEPREIDDEDLEDDSSSHDETPSQRKPSFRQYTMHLNRISSLEDETSDWPSNNDSIVSEPCFGLSPNPSQRGKNPFRPGQPAYQSAILLPSTARGGKGKKSKGRHKEDGDQCSGRDSPSTMSDMDVPSSSNLFSSSSIESQQMMMSQAGTSGNSSSSSQSGTTNDKNKSSSSKSSKSGGLLKWKGVVFSQDQENEDEDLDSVATSTLSLRDAGGGPSAPGDLKHWSSFGRSSDDDYYDDVEGENLDDGQSSSSRDNTNSTGVKVLPQRRSPDGRETCDMMEASNSTTTTQCNGEQIFTVQLSRRWCSRLGFSLQGANGHNFISAIYPDSVAAKDGRLRVGDEIIMVNGETVRDVETPEVIDIMRKIRGTINITLLRKKQPKPEPNSSGDHQLGLT